ncbi:MAG: endonuclease/exonuclease/phosphatase family protein [Bacteroidia bacterium]
MPITLLVFVTALLSSLATYISPQTTWVIAVLGLGFPYIYIVNFIFIVYWTLKKRRIVFLLFIPFIVGLKTIPAFFQLNFSDNSFNTKDTAKLKIMSYNVRSFDLYNWSGNYSGTSKVRENIFKLIKGESPGIVCFQEFYTSDTGKYQTVKTMQRDLQFTYSQVELTLRLFHVDHWGMAIFSKYPIIKKQVINFKRKAANMCLIADVVVNGDTIRVYNCHLQSIRFDWDDYKYVNELGYKIEEEKLTGAKKIFLRLKKAFPQRAVQTEAVAEHIRSSPYPVILCGDFNDTPSSYSYAVFNSMLTDAFRQSGSGIGSTYIGPFPAFRIDYIFHSSQISSSDYHTIHQKLADHFPIACDLSF